MDAPRVLVVDLERPADSRVARGAPAFEDPLLVRLAAWGGSALGLAWLADHQRRTPAGDTPLVVTVGQAVLRGVPTAARATIQGRAPLSGGYAEGHVGGGLGPRLGRFTDALVLRGRAGGRGTVLVIDERGGCACVEVPELVGATPAATAAALVERFGPCATLAVGPAGERGLAIASLASGHAPPSFVGRGGMGALLGRAGLKAVCLIGTPPAGAVRVDELLTRLAHSPRLAERAAGGTLELFRSAAVRGELAPELGQRLAREAQQRAGERHGCRGCPTPCGWVFERPDGTAQGARFGAGRALGPELGLATLDDALALLARCDALGIDAKEVGAVLALECTAQERGLRPGASARGDRERLARRIDALVSVPDAPGSAGAAALARELGLAGEVAVARGQALRPERDLAALLGQCVASGGADPMRTFPFLVGAASSAALETLLAPYPLDEATLDPERPEGKGRLVAWHENLITAVDLTGFCAFSAAGLLADGLCERDELARWILPAALAEPDDPEWAARAPGERLLAAGATLVLLRRALSRRWGARSEDDRPPFARAALDQPGMLDEYLRLRGAGDRRTDGVDGGLLGSPRVLELGLETLAPAVDRVRAARADARTATRPGRVTLRLGGTLAAIAGEALVLEHALPAPLEEVLRALTECHPHLARQFFAGTRAIPAVWRAGKRVAADDVVRSEDVLDVVTAIGGG